MRANVVGVAASGRGDDSRPSSQGGRDYLVVEAQSMPLAEKILHVRVFHVTAGTSGSTPSAGAVSPLRLVSPDTGTVTSSSGGVSQSLGFRVLAIDELDNEFSLFVTRQKAEYICRPQSPAQLASSENATFTSAPSLEEMANSIIDHIDIIGNRNRDIGKLICREPEVHVAKRTRAMPARDAASKQKNPHLMAKNDQRAARAKKTVLRTMEAIATAQERDSGASVDHEEVSPRSRRLRKSSDESLLHRMAFSNEKPVWRSDLETNYEEQLSSSATSVVPSGSTSNVSTKASLVSKSTTASDGVTTNSTGASRRVVPERKHKHKGLYERREKERKQRLLVTRAKSSSNILEPESVASSSPSVAALAVLEKPGEEGDPATPLPDPKAIRARFNTAVRTAFAVHAFLGVKTPPESEQFLRRRMIDHTERRVLKGNDFGTFPGMGIEITHERPMSHGGVDEDDPLLQEKLRILTQAARRSSFVRDKDGNLIRRSGSSRSGSSRRQNSFGVEPLAPLATSASAPVLGAAVEPVVTSEVVSHEKEQVQEAFQDAILHEKPLSPASGNDVSALLVDNEVADFQPSVEACTPTSPRPTSEGSHEYGYTPDSISSTADPEIVFESRTNPQSRTPDPVQTLLPVTNPDVAVPTAALVVETSAVTDVNNSPSLTPGRSSKLSPIVSSRRQTCWDTMTSTDMGEPNAQCGAESAGMQVRAGETYTMAASDDQPIQQSRPRPKSADDTIVTKSSFERAHEISLSPPNSMEAEEPVHGSVAESMVPNSARESIQKLTIDMPMPDRDMVAVGDVHEQNLNSASSYLDNDNELRPIAPQITDEPQGSVRFGQKTDPSSEYQENLVEDLPDKKSLTIEIAPSESDQPDRSRLAVIERFVVDSTSDRTSGDSAPSTHEAMRHEAAYDTITAPTGESILDEQAPTIAAAAAAAVVAAATAQTSNKPTAPLSTNSLHPSSAANDSSTSSKGLSKTYSASLGSSQRGGPALPRDSRNSPGKRRASIIRQPGQVFADAKIATRRKSVVKGSFPALPELSGSGPSTSHGPSTDSSNVSGGASSTEPHSDDHSSHIHKPTKSKHRQSAPKNLLLTASLYHKTWSKWVNGRSIVEKLSCLQLEEQVLSGSQTEGTLVKLGLRYARWSGTSLAAILLLEHAAALHETAPRTHEFWNSMGNAHLDIFLRNRKFMPAASFHLERCVKSLTRAFAFMESMADPLLLLRFALCLFWHPKLGNQERADEIFRQLFTKFASFCDKDRMNLLFVHFQVLHRLKMFTEACECIDKVIALATSANAVVPTDAKSDPRLHPLSAVDNLAYEPVDYWMMKMQCQQASGDYVQATATFSRVVVAKGFVQDGNLMDEQYLELWLGVAEKCFQHEDYTLAAEYYPVALNFAKESQLLATLHYKLGLCFQALGDSQRCIAEYKRARNMNRHVRPPVSLTELRGNYDDQFALLLEKSVRQVIEEVRVNLYDHAVRQLQRMFRRKRQAPSSGSSATEDAGEVKMPLIASRKLSRPLSRPRPISGSQQAPEVVGSATPSTAREAVVSDASAPVEALEESGLDTAIQRQAEFEARKQAALDQIKQLRNAPSRDAHPPGLSPDSAHVIRGTTQSELLSPEKERPDIRRLRSMATFNQAGACMRGGRCRGD